VALATRGSGAAAGRRREHGQAARERPRDRTANGTWRTWPFAIITECVARFLHLFVTIPPAFLIAERLFCSSTLFLSSSTPAAANHSDHDYYRNL
jgi:hypothetical protein